jgi:hypothetical protein
MAKEKLAKKNIICHKEMRNGSNHAQCRWQFKEHMKNKQVGQASKSGGPAKAKNVVIMSVLLTNALSIQMEITCGGIATRTLSINTRNSLQRVPKRVKPPTHEANLIDIEPAEKATNRDPSLVTAINESELSKDELNAYMLDSFNKTLAIILQT